MTPAETERLMPVRRGIAAGGGWIRTDLQTDPRAAGAAIRAYLAGQGVDFLLRTHVGDVFATEPIAIDPEDLIRRCITLRGFTIMRLAISVMRCGFCVTATAVIRSLHLSVKRSRSIRSIKRSRAQPKEHTRVSEFTPVDGGAGLP
ncbi:hypothetical protein ACQUSY_07860 [Microbacterium sp. YY-03]|uniref:hypothetical protein n=1 Tax=Microbacterium sp. YY-03 TaxID=3421636 RepID=UPI003D16BEAF